MKATSQRQVPIGRISGVFGIKGWVKVHSYTDPRENIVNYGRWILCQNEGQRQVEVQQAAAHGRGVIAKLAGVEDRDHACSLVGAEIAVARADFPPCGPDEYYWADLEGLEVETVTGEKLGAVEQLLATRAHDVLLLSGERQRLIPFEMGSIVRSIDLEAGKIVVDWDPQY